MRRYLKTLRYLVSHGVRKDKALLVLQTAFALSPEQITELARRAG